MTTPRLRLSSRLALEALEDRTVPVITNFFTTATPTPGLEVVSGFSETNKQLSITVRDIPGDNMVVGIVTLVVFERFHPNTYPSGDPTQQAFFSMAQGVLDQDGEVLTLTAAVPGCGAYQGDLAIGPEVVPAPLPYWNNPIERAVYGENICTSPPPPVIGNGFDPRTIGYWKTHGPVPTGNNAYVWPASVKANGLSLGGITYTPTQLLAILNTPPKGNGAILLAHQLIGAKLNQAAGATVSASVQTAIGQADALLAGASGSLLNYHGGGALYLAPSTTSGVATTLDNFNNS